MYAKGCGFSFGQAVEFVDGFGNGAGDNRVGLQGFVHIVERQQVCAVEFVPLQSPRLAHKPSQSVSVHRVTEKGFGCPDQHFGVKGRKRGGGILTQVCHAQGPSHELTALLIESVDAHLAAQTLRLGECVPLLFHAPIVHGCVQGSDG